VEVAAAAQSQSWAWELPYTAGGAEKKRKKKALIKLDCC